MTKDELIHKLAVILAGLQAPRSLDGKVMLGAACEPWDDVKQALTGFGWTNAEEMESALRKVLI